MRRSEEVRSRGEQRVKLLPLPGWGERSLRARNDCCGFCQALIASFFGLYAGKIHLSIVLQDSTHVCGLWIIWLWLSGRHGILTPVKMPENVSNGTNRSFGLSSRWSLRILPALYSVSFAMALFGAVATNSTPKYYAYPFPYSAALSRVYQLAKFQFNSS